MMKIEFTIDAHSGVPIKDQINRYFHALGYVAASGDYKLPGIVKPDASFYASSKKPRVEAETDAVSSAPAASAGSTWSSQTPGRIRGQAAPGRERRRKFEVQEDNEADERDAANALLGNPGAVAAAQPALISSGAERINPEAVEEEEEEPEDSEEDQEQDDEDEEAEGEDDESDSGLKTLDHVRDAVGRYYHIYGMGAAVQDVQNILGCKMHEIPDNSENYAKALEAIETAIEENPFGRLLVNKPKQQAAPEATAQDLAAEMGKYVKAYGEPAAKKDLPTVIGAEGIFKLDKDPKVYAEKIALVKQAVIDNPYGRKRIA